RLPLGQRSRSNLIETSVVASRLDEARAESCWLDLATRASFRRRSVPNHAVTTRPFAPRRSERSEGALQPFAPLASKEREHGASSTRAHASTARKNERSASAVGVAREDERHEHDRD